MLAKAEKNIDQKLLATEKFGNLEDILINAEGYKQAIKEAAAEQFAEDPAAHMDIIQTRKLLESLGIGKTKKADSN